LRLLVDVEFTNFRWSFGGKVLARRRRPWHGAAMKQNSGGTSRAGGFIIAVTIMAGAIVGARFGQPSLGLVIGTGIGVAMTLALYIYDRRRA